MRVNLDGRRLLLTENSAAGVAAAGETVFDFRQDGTLFWASYGGGHIARGVLVGRHEGGGARFWFQQLNEDGEFRAGTATSSITQDATGAVVMRDAWRYTEGAVGAGEAVLVEIGGAP